MKDPMKDPMKLAQCMSQCKLLKNGISFMQDTHIIGNQTTVFDDTELKGWTFINSGMKVKASAGVGIALSPKVKIVDINNILDGRIIFVRLILHGIKVSAFCAYAPPSYMLILVNRHFLTLCKNQSKQLKNNTLVLKSL